MFAREKNIVAVKFTEGEIIENLKNLMEKISGNGAVIINGIGQLENTVIGYFDGKDYIERTIEERVELLSLQGNIGKFDGKYIVHAHAILGKPNHDTAGGHLIRGNVKVVNEIFLYILDEMEIKRERRGKLMEIISL